MSNIMGIMSTSIHTWIFVWSGDGDLQTKATCCIIFQHHTNMAVSNTKPYRAWIVTWRLVSVWSYVGFCMNPNLLTISHHYRTTIAYNHNRSEQMKLYEVLRYLIAHANHMSVSWNRKVLCNWQSQLMWVAGAECRCMLPRQEWHLSQCSFVMLT